MNHFSPQTIEILDALRTILTLYAAFRVIHGMKVGFALGTVVVSSVAMLFFNHTPPGYGGPDDASLLMAISVGVGLFVVVGHWLNSGITSLIAAAAEYRDAKAN